MDYTVWVVSNVIYKIANQVELLRDSIDLNEVGIVVELEITKVVIPIKQTLEKLVVDIFVD